MFTQISDTIEPFNYVILMPLFFTMGIGVIIGIISIFFDKGGIMKMGAAIFILFPLSIALILTLSQFVNRDHHYVYSTDVENIEQGYADDTKYVNAEINGIKYKIESDEIHVKENGQKLLIHVVTNQELKKKENERLLNLHITDITEEK